MNMAGWSYRPQQRSRTLTCISVDVKSTRTHIRMEAASCETASMAPEEETREPVLSHRSPQ